MIAVPTTAGTGSEMQSFALISDAETHQKMGLAATSGPACRVAILDPKLTLTQPIKSQRDRHGCPFTRVGDLCDHQTQRHVRCLQPRIMETAFGSLSPRLAKFKHPDARASMQLRHALPGWRSSIRCWGQHAGESADGRQRDSHGQAVGLCLPHVIRFNGEQFGDWYRELYARCRLPIKTVLGTD